MPTCGSLDVPEEKTSVPGHGKPGSHHQNECPWWRELYTSTKLP